MQTHKLTGSHGNAEKPFKSSVTKYTLTAPPSCKVEAKGKRAAICLRNSGDKLKKQHLHMRNTLRVSFINREYLMLNQVGVIF